MWDEYTTSVFFLTIDLTKGAGQVLMRFYGNCKNPKER